MNSKQLPPAQDERYRTTEDLIEWMSQGFEKFGDIFQASIYGTPTYLTRDPQHAQHVLIDNWQNYVKGQFIKRIALLLGNGLMVSEGRQWKTQRRMIQPAFHRKTIGSLTQLVGQANLELLQNWQSAALRRETVNVTKDLSHLILKITLLATFGRDYEEIRQNFSIVSDYPERDPEFARSFRSLSKIVDQVIRRRRESASASDDFLGMFMHSLDEQGHGMSDTQLVQEILTLVVAGHETTSSALNWTWYLISQAPVVEEKLFRELDRMPPNRWPEIDDLSSFVYTRQVIEESLRLYPPGWLMTRRAVQDDQLGPYFLPAGTEVFISPYFIQRNPALWEQPERFDPDRFHPDNCQNRHRLAMQAFSAGPRNCIGEFLARIEMQIHLITVAKHLRLGYAPTAPLHLEAGVNLRNRYDFVMTPQVRDRNFAS